MLSFGSFLFPLLFLLALSCILSLCSFCTSPPPLIYVLFFLCSCASFSIFPIPYHFDILFFVRFSFSFRFTILPLPSPLNSMLLVPTILPLLPRYSSSISSLSYFYAPSSSFFQFLFLLFMNFFLLRSFCFFLLLNLPLPLALLTSLFFLLLLPCHSFIYLLPYSFPSLSLAPSSSSSTLTSYPPVRHVIRPVKFAPALILS
jgi:hypothetical protein